MRVADDGATLLWPDYIGNWMFNTMGEAFETKWVRDLGLKQTVFVC